MKHTRFASALALPAFAILAGCQLIKVNGKPLGGGSSSPPPATPGSAPAPESSYAASPASSAPDSSPDQPAAPAEPGKPAASAEWCASVGQKGFSSPYDLDDFKDIKIPDDNPTDAAGRFAGAMCTRGEVKARDQIMALRARWMKAIEIDERDFTVLAAKARSLTYEQQNEDKIPGPLGQLASGSQQHGIVELDQLGNRASMYTRFAVVSRCLRPQAEHNPLLRHILCAQEPLDKAKAYAEIDSVEELNNGTRYRLRRLVKETADRVAQVRAEIAAKAKEDPGIAKVVAIAQAQFKEWASPSAERAKLIAQLEAMEAATKANKRSAFAGCEDKTRASWEEQLARVKLPKVPSQHALPVFVEATMSTAEGYLAFQALRLCSASTERQPNFRPDLAGTRVVRRGPRTATVAAWHAAAGEIQFDDRSLNIGALLVNGTLPGQYATSGLTQREGVIAKLEDADGELRITFKTVIEPREDCLEYKTTNRIVMFEADGDPIYYRQCIKWGTIKMNLTAQPIRVPTAMAQGLKPGMFLVAIDDGYAVVATSSPKSAKPVWVLGGKVK